MTRKKSGKLEHETEDGIHPDVGKVPRIQIYLDEKNDEEAEISDDGVALSYRITIGKRQMDGVCIGEARARLLSKSVSMHEYKPVYLLEATHDNPSLRGHENERRFNVIKPFTVEMREEAKYALHGYALTYAGYLDNLLGFGILDFTGDGPRHKVECL